MTSTTINQKDIFGPFFAMIFLTIFIWFYMYSLRIPFLLGYVKKHKVPMGKYKLDDISPPHVKNPSDNLKNLFEVPVLFYAVVFYLFCTNTVDATFLRAAWIYAVLRWVHSAVHCTVNIIKVRFYVYAVSCLTLFFMVVRAAYFWYLE